MVLTREFDGNSLGSSIWAQRDNSQAYCMVQHALVLGLLTHLWVIQGQRSQQRRRTQGRQLSST